MSTAETARTVVGILGNIISLCLFLSPLPTFVKIVRRRTVGQFSPTPYLATLMNCTLWVLYGMPFVKPHSTLVLTINGTGMFLESIYLAVFFFFAPREMRVFIIGIILGEAAFVGAVTAGVLAGVHTHDKRRQIVGIFCVIFGTGMYAAPLVVMRTVVKSRSVQFMPFWLSLASFLNGVCWTTYAVIKFDIFITIPNALGTMLAILQLVLYFMYYRTDPIRQVEMQEQEPTASGNGSLNGIAINTR